jgi:hypothetical protein
VDAIVVSFDKMFCFPTGAGMINCEEFVLDTTQENHGSLAIVCRVPPTLTILALELREQLEVCWSNLFLYLGAAILYRMIQPNMRILM